ncbi:MAG TPA: GNAT family N-acetyltransferase [Coriobacteriia bacterium]|nr:GNAT family N-acetyltransferase [Coriobacteriia bacterium]
MILRAARAEDVAGVLAAARRAHAEAQAAGGIYARLPFDEAICSETLSALIGREDALVLLAIDGERIVGGVMAAESEHWASRARYGHELALIVEPEARGRLVGLRLVQALVGWARARALPMLLAGASSGVDHDRTRRIYEFAGLREAGIVMRIDP